jgi:hypothetical protein
MMPEGQKTETTPSGTSTPEATGDGVKLADPNALVTVKVDGVEKRFPVGELVDEYSKGSMRQSDYTKKTQALAAEREEWQKKVAEAEKIASQRAGIDSVKEHLAELFAPKKSSPLEDVQAFETAWNEDAVAVIKDALKTGVVGRGKADKEMRLALEELKGRLEQSEAKRDEAIKLLNDREMEREARALEEKIRAAVPEYETDQWVNVMTRVLIVDKKPNDILGGKIGEEMSPIEVARAVAKYADSIVESRIEQKRKAEADRAKSATLGNRSSSVELPDAPAEIEAIKDPHKRLVAKLKFLEGQGKP